MKPFITTFLWLLVFATIFGQPISNDLIKERIAVYKADIRGPYKEIRWYCPDGSIIPPKERCPEPGGVQRARHKDEVTKLAATNHIFLGQILATTPNEDFWDAATFNSRLKQYQLEKYLRSVNNGWILQRAQYYRGAYQAEDEEQWGLNFYYWLLSNDQIIESQYFLIRESIKDLPHMGDDNLKQSIRSTSKEISDSYSPFLDIRIKIHGQPEASDIQQVKDFREKHKAKLEDELLGKLDKLLLNMQKQYQAFDISSIDKHITNISGEAAIYNSLKLFQSNYLKAKSANEKVVLLSEIIFSIRPSVLSASTSTSRLALLDISVILEDLLFKEMAAYSPVSLAEQINIIKSLGMAATGCGYLEEWEWEQLKTRLQIENRSSVSQQEMIQLFEAARSITEWSTGMFMAIYEDVVTLYTGFEPLANGFIDDKVRASLLLQVGLSVDLLARSMSDHLPATNQIMNLSGVAAARGLNPGLAKGELVVISGSTEGLTFEKDKIYVFNKPPSDLKPVAGIATVSEGNPVSHIQLLARNLGIPNAVISLKILEDLKQYHGQTVFYAVSSKGAIVLKPENNMTTEESALFLKKEQVNSKLAVPVDKIVLDQTSILNLSDVNAASSGIVCGPKAANLGQLKQIFPEHVVEGIVIPFGIFREHLNQKMPGQDISFWEYLNRIYDLSASMRNAGDPEADIEKFMLGELLIVRQAIQQIQFSESFIADLKSIFQQVFNKELGDIPVFLRSDTNMEDLKEFTGAGLNLTLFNVVSEKIILQGIRDVWASPYTERSYMWRQRYLTNPENVFPSILIIPSVDVDYSGVVVTRGVGQGTNKDLTVAFSYGAGGAVDGQAAESRILKDDGSQILLSPAREPMYIRLPVSGGTSKHFALFEKPILEENNLSEIRNLSQKVKHTLPKTPGIETSGPFDIELGFKDNKLWLFQVRPFVENKNASTQNYLESLNPVLNPNKLIHLNESLN